MHPKRCLFAGLCALCLITPAAGDIYIWEDENGVMRYTDTPPPEGARIMDRMVEIPNEAEPEAALDSQEESIDDLLERQRALREEDAERRQAQEREAALQTQREQERRIRELEREVERLREDRKKVYVLPLPGPPRPAPLPGAPTGARP